MKFPTVEQFEQNKAAQQIIKWRELPENVMYHVKSVSKVAYELMYAELEDGKGNEYKTWLPTRLSIELKDYGCKERIAFIKPKGLKQSETNPERQYFAYDIMWEC